MAELSTSQYTLWLFSLVVRFVLVFVLFRTCNYRVYTAFTFYFLLNFARGVFLFATYNHWLFASPVDWRAGWATQALIVFARAMAVAELCRLILAPYRGVWAFAWRILLVSGSIVLLYSLISSKLQWVSALPSAERALDLAIASAIVGVFLFARYYNIHVEPPIRILAYGFCLFSCASVLNNTVLERWLYEYSDLWNLLNSLAFLGVNFLWIWALRAPQEALAPRPLLLPDTVYAAVASETNLRLRLLNKSLSQFWKLEEPLP